MFNFKKVTLPVLAGFAVVCTMGGSFAGAMNADIEELYDGLFREYVKKIGAAEGTEEFMALLESVKAIDKNSAGKIYAIIDEIEKSEDQKKIKD